MKKKDTTKKKIKRFIVGIVLDVLILKMKQYNKKYTSDGEVIQSNRRFIFCLVWDIEGNLLGDNILIVHVYLLRSKCKI